MNDTFVITININMKFDTHISTTDRTFNFSTQAYLSVTESLIYCHSLRLYNRNSLGVFIPRNGIPTLKCLNSDASYKCDISIISSIIILQRCGIHLLLVRGYICSTVCAYRE